MVYPMVRDTKYSILSYIYILYIYICNIVFPWRSHDIPIISDRPLSKFKLRPTGPGEGSTGQWGGVHLGVIIWIVVNNKRNSKKQWMIGPAMVLIGEAWNMWLIVVAERSNFEMFSQRQSGKLDTKQRDSTGYWCGKFCMAMFCCLSNQQGLILHQTSVEPGAVQDQENDPIEAKGWWFREVDGSNKDFGATGMLNLLGIHWDFSWDFMGNTWDLLRWQAMLL